MSNKNNVVADDTNPDSQNTGLESGAQTDDLETLLGEIDTDFDKGNEGNPESENEDAGLKNQVAHLLQKDENAAISNAVTSVQDGLKELDVRAPNDAIEGMLNQMAIKDTRFMKAFQERDSNPEHWNKVLNAASKSIAKSFGDPVDKALTDDRESVAKAIRGTSTSGDEGTPKGYKGMSDAEFEAEKLNY